MEAAYIGSINQTASAVKKKQEATMNYNEAYKFLEGLTEEDYIAFPDPELCKAGVPTTHDAPSGEVAESEAS